jgi:hypothetical protein
MLFYNPRFTITQKLTSRCSTTKTKDKNFVIFHFSTQNFCQQLFPTHKQLHQFQFVHQLPIFELLPSPQYSWQINFTGSSIFDCHCRGYFLVFSLKWAPPGCSNQAQCDTLAFNLIHFTTRWTSGTRSQQQLHFWLVPKTKDE